MNDIDFIKECCAVADGFSMIEKRANDYWIDITCGPCVNINSEMFKSTSFPLLLQKAVEGVNHLWVFQILQPSRSVFTVNNGDGDLLEEFYFNASDPDDILKSKREALEYVFKQMKGDKPS